ncbi:terpene synthase 9 [Pyrus ussuriensis x Pyrus communis]|uniref:Terpene synthase 9 n=1 Tax=Pyrus ussuriensis x Pyrus communis TaxID=2448454 RepID=A0A5N5GAN5_9ROSA|nr:terpene synthase 9 [Pyrus ussuriensis x Pyrus communis]
MALITFSSLSPSLVSTSTRHQGLIHLPKVLLQRTVGKQPSFVYVSTNSSPSSEVISNRPAAQRRSAQYHPTIWDSKLIDSFTTHYTYELQGTRLEHLKQNVTETLLAASTRSTKDTTSTLSMLKLIDSIQRLGVAYHFEKEIQAVLTSLGSSSTANTPSDLHTVALQFRILREHGIPSSPDVFNKFRTRDGRFEDSLSKDIEGLLSLYEASHLGTLGEDHVLEEAKSFSAKKLRQLVGTLEGEDGLLKQLVQQSMEIPLHWRMPRIEARSFIDIYKKDDSRNMELLELAKLDYNIVQSVYQREIKELSRWWRDLDFEHKANFSRDRLMENYLWAMGINYEPQFSNCRIGLTKFVCILTVIDDMYDVYGFLDELELFAQAVYSWNMEAKEELPEYMQPIYTAMLDFGNEVNDNVFKINDLSVLPYIKKEWVNLCNSYLVEARWFYCGYTPTLDEYIMNAWTSVGGPGAILHAYLLLQGRNITKSSLDSVEHGSQIIYWSSLVTRLSDDLATSKAESERGDVAKSVECCMKERGISEEEAQDCINELISSSWKKINEESSKTAIPKSIVKMSLNMARTAHSIFQHGDGIGTSNGDTKDRLISLIANPIPIIIHS